MTTEDNNLGRDNRDNRDRDNRDNNLGRDNRDNLGPLTRLIFTAPDPFSNILCFNTQLKVNFYSGNTLISTAKF